MQRGMFESQKGPSGREDRGGVELSGDSMEEADEFVRNGVLMTNGDLFDSMENDGCFKDGGVERANSMYGQERRVN